MTLIKSIMKFEGKVAVVTGSANGLGKAIAEALLSAGANVCVSDINVISGQGTTEVFKEKYGDDKVFFSQCDVAIEDDIKAVIKATKERFGGFDIMVNNAGILHEIDWQKMLTINLVGVISGTRLAIDVMRSDHGGRGGVIINMGSVIAVYPSFNVPVYAAAKYGLFGYTRSCATNPEYQQAGVSFAVICPGMAETAVATDVSLHEKIEFPFKNEENHFTQFGLIKPEKVGDAVMKLLQENDPNGAVLTVSEAYGVKIQYPGVMDTISLL